MDVINSKQVLKAYIRSLKQQGLRIAFVPTMGNLHQGHLSLVECAKEQADRVIVSIFVNPIQFDRVEDLQAYPRTEAEDQQLLRALSVDAVFVPSADDMYASTEMMIDVGELGEMLEGASRQGHFSGMATVVAKLFNLVQPDVAVFGQKDFQQLLIMRHMVEQFDFPIDIIGEEIIREADGLAMSSRNAYLTEEERSLASGFYEALSWVADALRQQRSCSAEMCLKLQGEAINRLKNAGFEPDYVEVRMQSNLQVPNDESVHVYADLVVLGAAWLGRARLIDNIPLGYSCS